MLFVLMIPDFILLKRNIIMTEGDEKNTNNLFSCDNNIIKYFHHSTPRISL